MSQTSQNERRQRILLVGASGTIGRAIAAELGQRHDLIHAGRSGGDVRLDFADTEALRRTFDDIGTLDAIVAAAGSVHFAPLDAMNDELYSIGLRNKLMGQVNLALLGRTHLADGGSVTLTGGILADEPIRYGSSASMVNAALEGFVRAAAIELDRGLRINLVSPNVVVESLSELGPFFRGFEAIPAARAALAYSRSVEGAQTGQIYKVF